MWKVSKRSSLGRARLLVIRFSFFLILMAYWVDVFSPLPIVTCPTHIVNVAIMFSDHFEYIFFFTYRYGFQLASAGEKGWVEREFSFLRGLGFWILSAKKYAGSWLISEDIQALKFQTHCSTIGAGNDKAVTLLHVIHVVQNPTRMLRRGASRGHCTVESMVFLLLFQKIFWITLKDDELSQWAT